MIMGERIRLGISACLMGRRVRFDGGDRLDAFLANTWSLHVEFLELCPETEAGLGIPREPMRLCRTVDGVSAVGVESGKDKTAPIAAWCEGKVAQIESLEISGFILKTKSPSCAGDETVGGGWAKGIFASLAAEKHPLIPVIDDKGIQDPALRDLFVTRIFTLARWRNTKNHSPTRAGLIAFHTENKMLFLAHSPTSYRNLGRIVADPAGRTIQERVAAYEKELLALLEIPATPGRHANALQHLAGYFRKKIDAEDRAELSEAIERFRLGLTPIAVPKALIGHHLRRHPHRFLQAQTYLRPHPLEARLQG